jgi:hypothetical protein
VKAPNLAQLQAEQKAAGLVAPRPDEDVVVETTQRSFIPPETVAVIAHPEQKSTEPVKAPFVGSEIASAGFCRILPPEMNSIRDAGEEWRAQNWAGPSPWCRVEGQPDHPDFEANLKAFE